MFPLHLVYINSETFSSIQHLTLEDNMLFIAFSDKFRTRKICVPKKAMQEQCSCNSLKKVSNTVWVCLKGMITENRSKEKCTNTNNFYDNYN